MHWYVVNLIPHGFDEDKSRTFCGTHQVNKIERKSVYFVKSRFIDN